MKFFLLFIVVATPVLVASQTRNSRVRKEDHSGLRKESESSVEETGHRDLYLRYKDGFVNGGYNQYGYDKFGYNKFGYDQYGYDQYGYDQYGYDRYGYDHNGNYKEGYEANGYVHNGYYHDAYYQNGRGKGGGKSGGKSKKGGAHHGFGGHHGDGGGGGGNGGGGYYGNGNCCGYIDEYDFNGELQPGTPITTNSDGSGKITNEAGAIYAWDSTLYTVGGFANKTALTNPSAAVTGTCIQITQGVLSGTNCTNGVLVCDFIYKIVGTSGLTGMFVSKGNIVENIVDNPFVITGGSGLLEGATGWLRVTPQYNASACPTILNVDYYDVAVRVNVERKGAQKINYQF